MCSLGRMLLHSGQLLLLAGTLSNSALADSPHHSSVTLGVDQIDVQLLANGDTRVDIKGHIANKSLVPLQQVVGEVHVSDSPQHKPVEVSIPAIDEIKPLSRQSYSVSYTFPHQQVMRPLIRPLGVTYKLLMPLQIADWLLGSAAPQLQQQHIPYNPNMLTDVRRRRLAALDVLSAIPAGDKDYQEARRKQGQILVIWAQELLQQGRREEAEQLLKQVESGNPYAGEAHKLLRQ